MYAMNKELTIENFKKDEMPKVFRLYFKAALEKYNGNKKLVLEDIRIYFPDVFSSLIVKGYNCEEVWDGDKLRWNEKGHLFIEEGSEKDIMGSDYSTISCKNDCVIISGKKSNISAMNYAVISCGDNSEVYTGRKGGIAVGNGSVVHAGPFSEIVGLNNCKLYGKVGSIMCGGFKTKFYFEHITEKSTSIVEIEVGKDNIKPFYHYKLNDNGEPEEYDYE